jgi:hypothetical protein
MKSGEYPKKTEISLKKASMEGMENFRSIAQMKREKAKGKCESGE